MQPAIVAGTSTTVLGQKSSISGKAILAFTKQNLTKGD